MTGAGMEVSKSKIAFFTNLITLREKFVVLSRGPQLSAALLWDGLVLSCYPSTQPGAR